MSLILPAKPKQVKLILLSHHKSESELSKIDPYAVARPQSTSNAPLNESQSSELREERSQQALPSNSRDENRSDLRRSTRTRKPPDRFGVYITH